MSAVVPPERLKVAFASAQAAEPAPDPKKVTVVVGADFPSLYLFRGIRQESDADLTLQPYVDVGIAASERVTVNVGVWNSVHTGTSGSGTQGQGALYETDFYGSVTYAVGNLSSGLLFTSYNSPNDAFNTVNELALVLSYDDSSRALPLSPKLVVATELSGQADGGRHRGTYLEAGIKPGFQAGPRVAIGVPIKLGTSVANYDEAADGDHRFGYFDIGVSASVPLSGGFEVHGGVDFYTFGATLKQFNANDRTRLVTTVGFSVTF